MSQDLDRDGVELAHYREHAGCGVLFYCQALGCGHGWRVELEAVIERLKARGVGDERTGIRAVGRLAEKPCPRCGALGFETRPGFQLRA